MSPSVIIWLCLVVLFVIVETATVSLVALWFIGGSLAALLAAALGAGYALQAAVFVVISAVLLLLLRPLAKKHLSRKFVPTNADRLIGKTALVTQTIDPLRGLGEIRVEGVLWGARCTDADTIREGELVRIDRIEGAKLVVSPAQVPVSTQ